MPPKKNKKPSKNGYWQFVMECRDKTPNKSTDEITTYAARKWANMTAEEKKPYANLAQLSRDTYNPSRCTSDGQSIDEIEQRERDAQRKEEQMKTDISSMLKTASLTNTLDEQIFLIIHVNHLTYFPTDDKYFICEVAIAAFSLRNGIEEVFHRIVKPGKLPLGYYGPALAHSKLTHQLLELVQDDDNTDETRTAFNDIISFMKRYSTRRKLPILYADEKTQEMTTKVFDNFCNEFNFTEEIYIYNLQFMFFVLRNASAGQTIWPTVTLSYSEIEKDVYSFTPNICCDFHEMSDITVYCSKSIVTRYAYILCDHCCNDLKIKLIPGRHVPQKARVPQPPISESNSRPGSACSSVYNVSITTPSVASSDNYNENYPPLGSSSASSVISFSSMKSSKERANSSKAAERLERSFQALNMTQPDHKNLKFPARRYLGRSQPQ